MSRPNHLVKIKVWSPLTLCGRRLGLMGAKGLRHGFGLALSKSKRIHTFLVRFSLDCVAIDESGRTIQCEAGIPSNRVVSFRGNPTYVIEMTSGEIERLHIREGSIIDLEKVPSLGDILL